jgi:hypothetical protein
MRKTKLTIHQQLYKENYIQTNKQLLKCKRDYYSNKIAPISNNQKKLHIITSDLIGNKREVVLPSYQNEKDLSNRFYEFFLGKIDTIRSGLCASISQMSGIRDFLSVSTNSRVSIYTFYLLQHLTKSEKIF